MTQTAQADHIKTSPIILGIESSCDETAAALLTYDDAGEPHVLSSIIASQDEEHAPYGGVVPEIAARAHMQKIDRIISQAVSAANMSYSDISAIAATAGPGLVGGVITGLMAGKGLALSLGIPFMGINHLEGHALSPRCLLYTSPSPRDQRGSRMPSSA